MVTAQGQSPGLTRPRTNSANNADKSKEDATFIDQTPETRRTTQVDSTLLEADGEFPHCSTNTKVHKFEGLLFDMDGTIIDSTDAIVKYWHKLGAQLGVDPESILASCHGRRTIDTLKLYDPEIATWDYVCEAERRIPQEFGQDAVELPGSRALLDSLQRAGVPWTIVTSATSPLVLGWLTVLRLSTPKLPLVTAEQVQDGKPAPECYVMGRHRLGLPESGKCLVLEDSPAGVRAGKAAGLEVLAVATTHSVKQLWDAGADWIVRDLGDVALRGWDGKEATVEFANAIQPSG